MIISGLGSFVNVVVGPTDRKLVTSGTYSMDVLLGLALELMILLFDASSSNFVTLSLICAFKSTSGANGVALGICFSIQIILEHQESVIALQRNPICPEIKILP